MFSKRSDNKPLAKLSDGKLVLTLPDAMTPVVWVINTNESGSFFMRVDRDDNGLYILQKIENSGKTPKIEDIAYYTDRPKAVNAMMTIGHVMDKQTTTGGGRSFGRQFLKAIFILLVLALLAIFAIRFVVGLQIALSTPQVIAPVQTGQITAPVEGPIVVDDPDAVGVPMSADSFMEKQESTLRLPF